MPLFLLAPPVNAAHHKPTCMRRPTAGARAQQGAAAVEFALILPVLLLVLLGTVELSLALYNKAILTNASREGARAGIVLSSPKMTNAQISAVVLNYTNGALISLGATTTPTVTVVQSSPASFPNALRVTVSYTYKGLGVGTMLGALGAPIVLTGSTSMVNE
jgi:Flp pilus assembly protein TadG